MDGVAVATFAVCVATLWLAYETRKVSKAAHESYELETIPYIALAGAVTNFGPLNGQGPIALQVQLIFSNPGKVMIHYHVNSFVVTGQGIGAPQGQRLGHGGVIHPSSQIIEFHPSQTVPQQLPPTLTVNVEFALSYWKGTDDKKSFKAKLEIMAPSNNSQNIWLYTNGPSYS